MVSYYNKNVGLESSVLLKPMTTDADVIGVDILTPHINFNGLPVFKSSSKQVWPILYSNLNVVCLGKGRETE